MSIKHRWAATKELLARYGAVFRHAWGERDNPGMKGGLFNEHEAEFLPAALALQERPISNTVRLTAWLLMGIVFFIIAWSLIGQMDIIVNASGKIIPSGYSKTIASVDVAAVRALHVTEGQSVHAGDVLIELDTSASDAERDKATGDAHAANLQVARSRALINAIDTLTPPHMPQVDGVSDAQWQSEQNHLNGQYQDFRSKLTRIDSSIAHYAEDLPLATQRARDYKALSLNHDVSNHAWLEKEQQRIDIEGQLSDAKNQRAAFITDTKKQAYDALTDAAKLAAASTQDSKRAAAHSKLLLLKAPVDGTVQQLTVHTVGGVVQAAQPLMLIVPKQHTVEVEAFIDDKDVGFVHEGQEAAVKIGTFEYTKYGTVPAKVVHVSRDAIPDDKDEKKTLRYAVRIVLDRDTMNIDGKEMPLTAGMSSNAEIKTGTRRVIEYVLSPLVKHQHEALNER